MGKPLKQRTADFKFKLVLESLKGDKTLIQLAAEHQIHPRQIQLWRNQFLDEGSNIFQDKRKQTPSDPDKERFLQIINQLTLELDFVRKKLKRNE